jgi:hypothetical protein
VTAARDPWLDSWREVGVAVREVRTPFAESAQGVATDGDRWFVVSNRATVGLMRKFTAPSAIFDRARNSRRVGVYDLAGAKTSEVAPEEGIWRDLVRLNRAQGHAEAIHFGAPAWVLGSLLVPTQRPAGIWVLSDRLARQDWWPDPSPGKPEHFSWVNLEPSSGLLYTSLHRNPEHLQALEWQSLRRVPQADIPLAASTPTLDRVQGGAFAGGGRVVLTSSNAGGQAFCYSTADGRCLGIRQFGDFHELEGLALAPVRVGGELAEIHVLDAFTHYVPFVRWGDSFTVRSFGAQQPSGEPCAGSEPGAPGPWG